LTIRCIFYLTIPVGDSPFGRTVREIDLKEVLSVFLRV